MVFKNNGLPLQHQSNGHQVHNIQNKNNVPREKQSIFTSQTNQTTKTKEIMSATFQVRNTPESLTVSHVPSKTKLGFRLNGKIVEKTKETAGLSAKEAGCQTHLARFIHAMLAKHPIKGEGTADPLLKGNLSQRIEKVCGMIKDLSHLSSYRTLNNTLRRNLDPGTAEYFDTYFYEGTAKHALKPRAEKPAETAKTKTEATAKPAAKKAAKETKTASTPAKKTAAPKATAKKATPKSLDKPATPAKATTAKKTAAKKATAPKVTEPENNVTAEEIIAQVTGELQSGTPELAQLPEVPNEQTPVVQNTEAEVAA